MTRLFAVTLALGCLGTAVTPACALGLGGYTPHPAVVRIMAPERNGASFGSGALVAVNDSHGLVVTNWHVVRDAAGPITVFFPDGFYSGATVLRTDREWDLAALAIWRPRVAPIALSPTAPQPGEMLTIAGYGSGQYRAASGRCTQYVSPGGNQPYEMVELDTAARNGDSGGPILNRRGELAGVLFGSAFGRTTGSYCGRLRWFLNSVGDDFQRMPSQTMLAQQMPQTTAPTVSISSITPVPAMNAAADAAAAPRAAAPATVSPVAVAYGSLPPAPNAPPAVSRTPTKTVAAAPATPLAAVPSPAQGPLPTPDQIKTIFAIIGVLAVGYVALRLLGAAIG